ncbi:DUF4244 domain-containing protein [Leucobacter sp. USCH14]|uniref:DUF4244 domain-containing protein n=1 Tax=Leucobacter sp. USCH14 TaxID=3024838 RepID=UPI0030AC67C5
MQPTLQLVSDRGSTPEHNDQQRRRAHKTRKRRAVSAGSRALTREVRELADDERGAVTAEYAIVIMAR